jgi:CDP-diglyceride synthetase
VIQLHDNLATSVLLFMAAVGFWGLFTFIKGGTLSGSIAGALVIGWVLVLAQGLFGAIFYVVEHGPSDSVHILYGITAALALPFVFSYTKDRDPRQALLMFSLASLFVAGLAIRGMTTGG